MLLPPQQSLRQDNSSACTVRDGHSSSGAETADITLSQIVPRQCTFKLLFSTCIQAHLENETYSRPISTITIQKNRTSLKLKRGEALGYHGRFHFLLQFHAMRKNVP